MPRADIASKQAIHILKQLYAELAGKRLQNKQEGEKLRRTMIQVETVMKLLRPDVDLRAISAKRRNIGNPWFKRERSTGAVIDTLRMSQAL